MITRDVNQIYVVPGFVNNARFTGCTLAGYTCTESGATSAIGSSEFYPGFTIDRLGLPRNYNAMMVAPVLFGDYQTSVATGNIAAITLSAGIMHSSATGGTFTAYSTENWIDRLGLWRQTTATSTATTKQYFTAVQRDVGLTSAIGLGGMTSTTTSTASGEGVAAGASSTSLIYWAGAGPAFSLVGAKRFIKCALRLQHLTTGDVCSGAGRVHMSAAAIFAEPDEAQPPYTANKRILVTSGCAT